MAVNPYKGEVALPEIGKGYIIAFTLSDIAALEAEFGQDFFATMEQACLNLQITKLVQILTIGLRKRNSNGEAEKVGEDFDFDALHQRKDFNFASVCPKIMDAISMSMLGKTHKELIEEALEARKQEDVENLRRAKEAAEEAGLPFNEALSDGLLNLLTNLASTPSPSGN